MKCSIIDKLPADLCLNCADDFAEAIVTVADDVTLSRIELQGVGTLAVLCAEPYTEQQTCKVQLRHKLNLMRWPLELISEAPRSLANVGRGLGRSVAIIAVLLDDVVHIIKAVAAGLLASSASIL